MDGFSFWQGGGFRGHRTTFGRRAVFPWENAISWLIDEVLHEWMHTFRCLVHALPSGSAYNVGIEDGICSGERRWSQPIIVASPWRPPQVLVPMTVLCHLIHNSHASDPILHILLVLISLLHISLTWSKSTILPTNKGRFHLGRRV